MLMIDWVRTTDPNIQFGAAQCVAGHWHAALSPDGTSFVQTLTWWDTEENALIFGRVFCEMAIQLSKGLPWDPTLN